MKKIIYIFVILILSSSLFGEINTIIDNFRDIQRGKVHQQLGRYRPFLGKIEFNSIPEPLQSTTVNFTLKVSEKKIWADTFNCWTIEVKYDNKMMALKSDSVFKWYGSHEIGETFSGSFDLIPLTSGQTGFSIYAKEYGYGNLFIRWCFDETGQLLFLDDPEKYNVVNCYPILTAFFTEDTVIVKNNVLKRETGRTHYFNYEFLITPAFRIGDTSDVRIKLVALKDFNLEERPIEVRLDHFELINTSSLSNESFLRGDTIIIDLTLSPKAVRNIQAIYVYAGAAKPVVCHVVFDNNGNLRLIEDQTNWHFKPELLPSSYPTSNDQTSTLILHDKKDSYDIKIK